MTKAMTKFTDRVSDTIDSLHKDLSKFESLLLDNFQLKKKSYTDARFILRIIELNFVNDFV
jgi:hypothetical protein